MPKPIDRGGGGYLFDRRAVILALGMGDPVIPLLPMPEWDFHPVKFAEIHDRNLRRRKGASWRDKRKIAPWRRDRPGKGRGPEPAPVSPVFSLPLSSASRLIAHFGLWSA